MTGRLLAFCWALCADPVVSRWRRDPEVRAAGERRSYSKSRFWLGLLWISLEAISNNFSSKEKRFCSCQEGGNASQIQSEPRHPQGLKPSGGVGVLVILQTVGAFWNCKKQEGHLVNFPYLLYASGKSGIWMQKSPFSFASR